MELNTRDFGIVSVEEDAVYSFPSGLYGFENCREFAIFEKKFDDISFLYLQNTEAETPCFMVFEPWELYPNYQPMVAGEDLKASGVDTTEDLIFLTIANLPGQSLEEFSINIKSPVVLNPKTREGRQVILQNADYKVRYQPFLETKKSKGGR